MSDEELNKLAAEMQNIKPSEAARKRGMDAAMAAFDTEFAAQKDTALDPAEQKISNDFQGIAAEPRPTGQSTYTKHVQTSGSSLMSKFKNIMAFNQKTAMFMGGATAALMVGLVVFSNTPYQLPDQTSSEGYSSVSAEVQSEVADAKSKDDITIKSTKRQESAPAMQRPTPVPVKPGAPQSVDGLMADIGKNDAEAPAMNRSREQKFRTEQSQSAARAFGNVPAEQESGETRNDDRVLAKPAQSVERSIPAVTKTETRRILDKDGSYKTITETIVVQDATTELVTIPPVYKNRDRFEDFKPNPVTSAKDTPVSTFSIDVDTASYSFLRSSINRGQIPQPSAIRVEEMINYFPYDYEAPKSADEPFKANVTVTPSPWNADTKLMHIGIKGYVPPASERQSSNIVFLIDTSGSMNQANKLPLLINSFKLLLGTLDDDDTVSIVTYAGSAGTVLEPTPASDKNKINEALNRLSAGGSTAGAAGLELAYQKAAESFDADGVNRVILATDGDFNVGFSSNEEMKRFIEKKRESGIFLSVLGFGNGNYNDELMQTLAQNGNGVAAYIDSLSEANKVLADESGGALFTIAKDVKIQVEFNPATIAEYRLIGYETRALKREDFNNDKVDAGEINSGHTVTAIYEMTPVGSKAVTIDDLRYVSADARTTDTGSDEFAFVKIRHKLPNSDTSTLQTFPIGEAQERSLKRAGDDMRFATAVAIVGQKLRGDTQLADFSYKDAIKLANGAKGEDEHGYRAEFVQLVRLLDSLQQ